MWSAFHLNGAPLFFLQKLVEFTPGAATLSKFKNHQQ